METTKVRLSIPDTVDHLNLMGPADVLLRRLEAACDALISVRGQRVTISGRADEVRVAAEALKTLMTAAAAGSALTITDVDQALARAQQGCTSCEVDKDNSFGTTSLLSGSARPVRPRTAGQKRYVDALITSEVTFGIGPAGTGKTYLAVAAAISALLAGKVERVILARPVVEAGESLGFLPGTLEEKLDPYVRPLFDALFDMLGPARTQALVDQGVIEVAPLAFMRGRTFSRAFVVLDEAQNTTPEQMRMALTRLGEGARMAITGDPTQRDLIGEGGIHSAQRVLEGIEGVSFVELGHADTVRSSLVARIVAAYKQSDELQGKE